MRNRTRDLSACSVVPQPKYSIVCSVHIVTHVSIARQRLGKQAQKITQSKYISSIARQRPQYKHATVEQVLQDDMP
jgi:spore germination cell wall hydrolase CwlJ-like protein